MFIYVYERGYDLLGFTYNQAMRTVYDMNISK